MNILLQESADILKEYFGERLDKMVVERAVFGLFFSGVKLSTGHGGLCFTPVKEIPEAVCCPSSAKAMPLSGKLGGRSVKVIWMIFHMQIFSERHWPLQH